jgi:hypothetical protein
LNFGARADAVAARNPAGDAGTNGERTARRAARRRRNLLILGTAAAWILILVVLRALVL